MFPVEITYRNFSATPSIEQDVRRHAEHLQRFGGDIVSCRVVISTPHRHQRKGRLFHVRVDLRLPGGELVVKRDPAERAAHQDLHVALRDAFDACRRELQDYLRVRRGAVKRPEGASRGRVSSISRADGFGYLEGADGALVWFDARSVLGDFASLQPGDEVRFTEEQGNKGPQASTVIPKRSRRREARAT
jgi:cold shock CspA family protein/ribosome-associated translation inhibitor RaiA